MSHQSVVSLFAFAFLWLVSVGMPAYAEGSASRQERGLETVKPDTIMRIGEQGPDKKGPPIEVFLQRDVSTKNAALSPNGHYLATTSYEPVILWDAKTGREIRRFLGSDRQPKYTRYGALLFDSTSRRIVTGNEPSISAHPYWNSKTGDVDKSTIILIYSVDSSTPVATYSATLGGVTALALSPDDRYLFSGHYNTVAIWDLKAGQIIRTINCDGFVFAFSPNLQYALCAPSYGETTESSTTDIENSIHLIDIATGKELRRFVGHTQPITAANFSNDGSILLSASRDGKLRIWNVATGNTTKVINVTQPKTEMMSSVGLVIEGVDSAILSPDGQYIIASYNTCPDSGDCKITTNIFERISGKKIQINDSITPIIFSQDSKYFFGKLPWLKNNEGGGVLVNSQTGIVIQSFRGYAQDDVHVLGFLSTTNKVLYAGENSVLALDLDTGMASQLLSVGAQSIYGEGKIAVAVRGIKGKYPATFKYLGSKFRHLGDETDIEYEIKLYDLLTGKFIREIRASTNRKALVWERGESWDEIPSLSVASVSNDTKYIVTISQDDVISVWDSITGREIRSIQHTAWRKKYLNIDCGLASVSISSDNRILLSVEKKCDTYPVRGKDMIRVWSVDTGHEVTAFSLEDRNY